MKKPYVSDLLWFDVGIKRYTTLLLFSLSCEELWFDVGIKRYTTDGCKRKGERSCGLM